VTLTVSRLDGGKRTVGAKGAEWELARSP
jgi:hypothetical protein